MDKISSPVDALVNKNPEGPAVISVWGYIYNINKYHAAYENRAHATMYTLVVIVTQRLFSKRNSLSKKKKRCKPYTLVFGLSIKIMNRIVG